MAQHTHIQPRSHRNWTYLTNQTSQTDLFGSVQGKHFVQFYDNELFLLKGIKKIVDSADCSIVIASKQHKKTLEDNRFLTATDTCSILEAEELLATFMVDSIPDRTRFFNTFAPLLSSLTRHKKILIFGEMVALLWAEGNQRGAIALEQLCNELQRTYNFSLICAYPLNNLGGHHQTELFINVCSHHSQVLPSESYGALETAEDRLREVALLQQQSISLKAEIAYRKKLEKQKDEFMGIVSHELKTPVTSLKAFTQVLHKKLTAEGNDQSALYLSKMDKQINRLTSLVRDLLDSTKIEGGILQFRSETFEFDALVTEIIEEIQHTAPNHTIIKKGAVKKMVQGDWERIGQVITNLLTNAIKYSPNADTIIVETSSDDKHLMLCVQDFGVGIRKEDKDHIFERFYRVTGDKQETFPGLGLGLYISSEIVQRHGGKIWVHQTSNQSSLPSHGKGRGSTFCFTLPLRSNEK